MADVYHTWVGYPVASGPAYVTEGLVGNWDAGDASSYPGSGTDWFDLTGNNDGVLTNGPVYTASPNPNFDFDGDNDFVELGSIDSSNPLSLVGGLEGTIELWVNPQDSGDNFQRMFDKNTTGSSIGGYGAYIRPSNDTIYFQVNGFVVNSVVLTTYTGWKQVVMTRDSAGDSEIYCDAVFKGDTSNTTAFPTTTANARIASWSHSTGREYKGEMGILRIYKKHLSAAEVLQNFNANKADYGL